MKTSQKKMCQGPCKTVGPTFADGEPLDLRPGFDRRGELRLLCFRCRASERIAVLEARREKLDKALLEAKRVPVRVPEKLSEAEEVRLHGLGVIW